MVKDGWHKLLFYQVYVENGFVTCAYIRTGQFSTCNLQPFKVTKDGLIDVSGKVKFSTLRGGLYTNRYKLG